MSYILGWRWEGPYQLVLKASWLFLVSRFPKKLDFCLAMYVTVKSRYLSAQMMASLAEISANI